MSVQTTESATFSIKSFAAWAGICRTNVYREINEQRLRAVKACGRTLIRREDAIAWLDACPPIKTISN